MLSFAHSKKRDDIQNKEEYEEVILACIDPCHRDIENMPKEKMLQIVQEIIAKREIQP